MTSAGAFSTISREAMSLKTEHRDLLRRLTLHDEVTLRQVMVGRGDTKRGLLDDRTRALVRLAGLVALGAEIASLQVVRDEIWGTGGDDMEIVDTVLTVAPIIGPTRIATVVPRLALALETD